MNYSSTDSKASEGTDTDFPTNGHSDNELLGSYEAFEDTRSSISDIDENMYNRKRPKKKESSQERNRKRRSTGKSYVTYKNKQVAGKKVLPNPCFGKLCTNNYNRFSDKERQDLQDVFWKMGAHTEKRAFINVCVNVISLKRKRTIG